jgi:hypothetical protein
MRRILNDQEINHHKMDHCPDRRDPEFKQNIAEVLYIYREVKSSRRPRRPPSRATPQ